MYNIKFPTDVSYVSVFAAVLCPSVYTLRSFSWIVSQVAIRLSTAAAGAKRCFNFFDQRILSVDRMTSQIPPVVKLFSSRRKWSKQTKHTPCETLDRGIQCLLNFQHTPVEKAACILTCVERNSGASASFHICAKHICAKHICTHAGLLVGSCKASEVEMWRRYNVPKVGEKEAGNNQAHSSISCSFRRLADGIWSEISTASVCALTFHCFGQVYIVLHSPCLHSAIAYPALSH